MENVIILIVAVAVGILAGSAMQLTPVHPVHISFPSGMLFLMGIMISIFFKFPIS